MGSRGRGVGGSAGGGTGSAIADTKVAGGSEKITSAVMYLNQDGEVDSFWRNMMEEKLPQGWKLDQSDDNVFVNVTAQTDKALKVSVSAYRIDGEYDQEFDIWMPRSAFSTANTASGAKFASEKSKTRALGDLAREQAKQAAVKKAGGSTKLNIGGKSISTTLLAEDTFARHNFVVNYAKNAGITGLKSNSSSATIVKKATEQGKFGEIASMFRTSTKSPSGYAYNNTGVAVEMSKNHALAEQAYNNAMYKEV